MLLKKSWSSIHERVRLSACLDSCLSWWDTGWDTILQPWNVYVSYLSLAHVMSGLVVVSWEFGTGGYCIKRGALLLISPAGVFLRVTRCDLRLQHNQAPSGIAECAIDVAATPLFVAINLVRPHACLRPIALQFGSKNDNSTLNSRRRKKSIRHCADCRQCTPSALSCCGVTTTAAST